MKPNDAETPETFPQVGTFLTNDDKPKSVEPSANAAKASITRYESSKTTESPLNKKEAEPPEVAKPVKYKSEKQSESLTNLKEKVATVGDTPTATIAAEKPTKDTVEEDTDPEDQVIPETTKNPENPMHPDNPETPVNDEPVETEAKEVTHAVMEQGDAAAATEPKPTVEHNPANEEKQLLRTLSLQK